MKDLAPEHVKMIDPYIPGKPIEETRREFNLGDMEVVKLASNENAFGVSPKALDAIKAALHDLNRYPDGGGYLLRRKIAEKFSVDISEVILGNGTNDIIDILVRAFVARDEEVIVGSGGFYMHKVAVKSAGKRMVEVPFRNLRFDLDAIATAITPSTKLIFIDNPNNPTGTYVTAAELTTFIDAVPRDVIIVMDEAYIDYVDAEDFPDSMNYRDRHPWLVVLRTLSKISGLAGLRIGFGFARSELTEMMNRVRLPFNTNSLAQAAAIGALDDDEFAAFTRAETLRLKKRLAEEVRSLGIEVTPSQTNFLFVDFRKPARDVYYELLRRGVIIRPMGQQGFPTCARITVGTEHENSRLIGALKEVLGK